MKKMPPEKIARIGELIEPWFIFALIWSVGATGDAQSRLVFSIWLKATMSAKQVSWWKWDLISSQQDQYGSCISRCVTALHYSGRSGEHGIASLPIHVPVFMLTSENFRRSVVLTVCFSLPQIGLLFPDDGLVYDYQLDDAGISNIEEEEDEDVINEVKEIFSLFALNLDQIQHYKCSISALQVPVIRNGGCARHFIIGFVNPQSLYMQDFWTIYNKIAVIPLKSQ